jgi:5'(3')-deoxyribonucleotidase
MTKLRIGIDIDGVLADFNVPYRELLLKEGLNIPPISNTYPDVWSYDKAAGLSKAAENQIWGHIGNSPDFWRNLPAYPDTQGFMTYLFDCYAFQNADIYFITSRPGLTAKDQTETWLQNMMFPFSTFYPTVLISSEKGMCARALKLTHYVDDRNENCADVYVNSPTTQTFMLARPWNQCQDGILRLDSLDEFESIIAGAIISA